MIPLCHYVHKIVEFDEIAQADDHELCFVLDYFEIFTKNNFAWAYSATYGNFKYITKIPRFVASRQSGMM